MKGKKVVNIISIILIVLTVFGLFTGFVCLIVGGISLFKYKSFCDEAIKTTGYVETVVSSPSKTTIIYVDEEGSFYEVSYNYETSLATEGDEVDLYYAEDDSTDVRVKGFDTLFSFIFFVFAGTFIFFSGISLIAILIIRGVIVHIMKKKQATE